MIEKIIQLENIKMNVKYSLDKSAVVLFIHFSGGNLNMWDGIIPQFEEHYSIIAPDIRGHGKSDKPEIGYHIDDMANDIYLLLQKLDVKQCHIVGSSMGAEVGLSLAASHPELVLSLICEGALFNEFGEFGLFNGTTEEIEQKKELKQIQLNERIERVFTTKEEYIEEVQKYLTEQGIWNEYFQAFFENNVVQLPDSNYTYRYLNRVRIEYIQKYWDLKFEDYYKKVRCPVLFLPSVDEWEDEIINKSLHSFASLVEDYEIERIENSIHAYVWMQLPTIVGEVALVFINKKNDKLKL
ncbi:alpha/beta hydrolase [Paenibacillus sp. GSMTC-2017]|uniref:alpha/beta fold hydrolase n=1 Tax=Paenibacillus sp. GSMTC-2017 TaxID=2794350 RepID=UPI0018D7CE8B|nr:alpha/beta hydrolase [Paenibacillus sp. GSMTC-2017]MBH5316242.1 alpha/beta hydrolase [Paenibacillus sp. GSMTC-2017]